MSKACPYYAEFFCKRDVHLPLFVEPTSGACRSCKEPSHLHCRQNPTPDGQCDVYVEFFTTTFSTTLYNEELHCLQCGKPVFEHEHARASAMPRGQPPAGPGQTSAVAVPDAQTREATQQAQQKPAQPTLTAQAHPLLGVTKEAPSAEPAAPVVAADASADLPGQDEDKDADDTDDVGAAVAVDAAHQTMAAAAEGDEVQQHIKRERQKAKNTLRAGCGVVVRKRHPDRALRGLQGVVLHTTSDADGYVIATVQLSDRAGGAGDVAAAGSQRQQQQPEQPQKTGRGRGRGKQGKRCKGGRKKSKSESAACANQTPTPTPTTTPATIEVPASMLSPAVDPGALGAWPGLPVGPTVGDQEIPALQWCFVQAVPSLAHIALSCGRPPEEFAPHVLFANTLVEVVGGLAALELQGSVARVSVSSPDGSRGYILELTVAGPLSCPPHVDRSETRWQRDQGEGGTADVEPLLAVKYLATSKDKIAAATDTRFVDAVRSMTQDLTSSPMAMVETKTQSEVDYALEYLRSNEERLAKTYTSAFYASSPHHAKDLIRPSFLVPPTAPRLGPMRAACATCGVKEKGTARHKRCAQCLSVMYCSPKCQRRHWKNGHKAVCGKSGAGVAGQVAQIDERRPSFLMPVKPPRMMGQCQIATLSVVDGMQTSLSTEGKTPRNIHGDNEFVVKVQVPMFGGLGTNIMVYDAQRSFVTHIPPGAPDSPELRGLINFVRHHGPNQGMKGYLSARREGNMVRIFYDKMLPTPSW
eukprot:m.286265 g.286265  ORF g.286265 m.286265 type:complete len:755 (-) comp19437_c2_seq6:1104-3368(-)